MMAGMTHVAAALPLRMAGHTGMAWCRPGIRPRLQAANDVAPLPVPPPGQGARLQAVLEGNYAGLHRRLARHLGCAELASDSLHDAWLRLGSLAAGDGAALAHSPVAYVFRVACNAAMDSLRRNRAWLYADEGDGDGAAGLVDFLADTAAGPERLAELQADVRRLAQAVDLLPRRHRQVLEALRVDELTRQEVAERHDMSLRNVDTALRQALDHCARHTGYAAQGGVGTTRRSLRLRQG
ncbi:sigma-70 family RNA polymerase sigma factor [Janthinobacterium lividum]|uniref:Sigma-70 family RNA polymerase sigma factor n=2 Tax=Janthinobacterium lividum TaxID=29581 RepID=A0ABU0XLE8_9BURK|nr:sigma-70 family RNA polymerase sigma factor [Janthinobacterium lividum]MDQ4624344.1 sigma-70 family RNA polymerase sigma factor [Janthinobacterium lividum]MDQ4674052.1 sigma-70 family RNA polymerase sigma factor [Janthinobacterium lividum]MDQ4684782.1 sigma-70 family RNA polymerase sigma factor [Janthinobacterium lividum]